MFGGDDDDDFTPASNSKLASLFSSKSFGEGNASLTYTAPKQPRKGGVRNETRNSKAQTPTQQTTTQPTASNKLSIIIVKAVNTFRLEDGSYNLQGKLGAAVLGNTAVCVYQLLLYKGKQHHITSTKITPKFQFTVQSNNYATFYDDQKQNWSIHFDEEDDAEEFAKEIGLARGNSQGANGGIQNLLTQDLSAGEPGPTANVGDSMEIFYTVKSFSDNKLGQLVESNLQADRPQRVKIRKNVWEEGLIGASKGSKRIILLPPSLVGPWKQEVPPDTSIVVEVKVSRLKQAKTSREGTPSAVASLVDSGESAVDSSTDDTSIKARGASISEALTASPKTHKANIISRMARMGQATLPLKGAVACNPSDSEDSEDNIMDSSATSKPPIIFKPSAKTRSSKAQPMVPQPSYPSPSENPPPNGPSSTTNNPPQQMAVYQPLPMAWHQQQQAYTMGQYGVGQLDGQLYPLVPQQTLSSHQMYSPTTAVSTPPGIPSADNHFSVFLSESRTHNTEVRMGVSKVIDKVDQVLSKLESAQNTRTSISSSVLDAASLLASIQKLVTENEQLKTEVAERGSKIEVQNDRIYQLLNTNQKYLEQSNSSSNDQRYQEVLVLELQREKAQLSEELRESKERCQSMLAQLEQHKTETSSVSSTMAAQLAQLQEDLMESKRIIVERDEGLHTLKEKMSESLASCEAHELTIKLLRKSTQEMKDRNEELEEGLSDLTRQMKLQKSEAEDYVRNLNAKYVKQVAALEEQEAFLKDKLRAEKKSSEPLDAKVVIDEVKRVMNIVYKTLHREFETDETYVGKNIHKTLITTIRDVTCELIERETFSTTVVDTVPVEPRPTQRQQQIKPPSGMETNKTSEEQSNLVLEQHSHLIHDSKHSLDGLTEDENTSSTGVDEITSETSVTSSDVSLISVKNLKPSTDDHEGTNTNSARGIIQLPTEPLTVPSEPHFNTVDNVNPTAESLKDVSGSSSDTLTRCAGDNSGDIRGQLLGKLPGETDLLVKHLPNTEATLEPVDQLKVASDPCVLGFTTVQNVCNDDRKESLPTILQDHVAKQTITASNVVTEQKATDKVEEKAATNLRESSLERKPWRSEPPPPPLFDDDEDEDDWLS